MSIRTVQTDFTSSSWSPPPHVLHSISMNSQQIQAQHRFEKYPPGLGYSIPAASESSPSLISGERTTRRRSGGFSYPSGQSYSSGNGQHILGHNTLTGPLNLAHPPFRRRLAPHHYPSGERRAPPASLPASHAPIKFDPFASDDTHNSEPVYNHYWQYNSSTKSPMLVYKNKPSKSSSASNNVPYTIKLPAASTISLPATASYRSDTRSSPLPLPKPDKNARARLVAGILLNRIYAVGKPMRRRFSTMGGDKAYVKSGLSCVISVEC